MPPVQCRCDHPLVVRQRLSAVPLYSSDLALAVVTIIVAFAYAPTLTTTAMGPIFVFRRRVDPRLVDSPSPLQYSANTELDAQFGRNLRCESVEICPLL
jgi:hypothetical protein